MAKQCVNCKFVWTYGYRIYDADMRCTAPTELVGGMRNTLCTAERAATGAGDCGPEGKLWQERSPVKETPPPSENKPGWLRGLVLKYFGLNKQE